jgi:hypothetical protein
MANSICTFTLNSFKITDTRSLHRDTVYVSVAAAVNKNPPISLPTKYMGNLNNGTFQVDLSIANVEVAPQDRVTFSYSIINSGYNKSAIEQKLQQVAESAASQGAQAGGAAAGGAIDGPVGSAIGKEAASWILGKLEGVVFADCDGTVAAAVHTYTGAQLAELTAGGKVISTTDENKGTKSPDGCGRDSHYFVTWSLSAHPKA